MLLMLNAVGSAFTLGGLGLIALGFSGAGGLMAIGGFFIFSSTVVTALARKDIW